MLYVEESGNPSGMPVVFLHGGPASGCKNYHRQFFNPAIYRIIIFDQRGAGRSTPYGLLENNNTAALISDLEAIRKRLNIEQWVLFGGSWGSTLALVYAIQHPQRVSAMILRGIFLASQYELDWFFHDGVNRIFPDAWEDLLNAMPNISSHELINVFYQQIVVNNDNQLQHKAVRTWATWTGKIATYTLNEFSSDAMSAAYVASIVKQVQIECHYAYHRYFLTDNYILDNLQKLPSVPVLLIHGRRDLTCPLENAWKIHRALAHSTLNILPEAGHLASEPSMVDALISATDKLALNFR